MIDTNAIAQVAQAAPQVQSVFNAWNAVALGAGAFLTGVYNHVVSAGGIKTIVRNLWSGPNQPSTPNSQSPK